MIMLSLILLQRSLIAGRRSCLNDVKIAASWEWRGQRLTVCETEFVTQLSDLVRLEQIKGASIGIAVNGDAKDSCDTANTHGSAGVDSKPRSRRYWLRVQFQARGACLRP